MNLSFQPGRLILPIVLLIAFQWGLVQCTDAPSGAAQEKTTQENTPDTPASAPAPAGVAETTVEPQAETPSPAPSVPAPPVTTRTEKKQKAIPAPTREVAQPAPAAREEVATTEKPEAPPAQPEAAPPAPAAPAPVKAPDQPVAAPKVVSSDFTLKSATGTVAGSSTLHPWESKITGIAMKGRFQSTDNVIETIRDVEVKIPVKGIKSSEGKTMDEKTWETLQSDKHPNITFAFGSAKVVTGANQSVTIQASGNLSMAGATKPVSLTAKGKLLSNGDLQLSVSYKLKMTDYGMKPPTMMMGTIKVGDEVTLNFNLVLTP